MAAETKVSWKPPSWGQEISLHYLVSLEDWGYSFFDNTIEWLTITKPFIFCLFAMQSHKVNYFPKEK